MESRSNRLYISIETKKYYQEVRRNYSHLKMTNSKIFSLALAMGYYFGIKEPLVKKNAFIRYETIEQDLLAMIDVLAIAEFGGNNQELIDNPLLGFDLAEEYANAGIKILVEKIYNSDMDFDSFLYETVSELYVDVDLKGGK